MKDFLNNAPPLDAARHFSTQHNEICLATTQKPTPDKAFDGRTYQQERDYVRLSGQLEKVFKLMTDGQWRTLRDIQLHVKGTEASISARLRDLRKPKYGAHAVEREHLEGGLFWYRLVINQETRP